MVGSKVGELEVGRIDGHKCIRQIRDQPSPCGVTTLDFRNMYLLKDICGIDLIHACLLSCLVSMDLTMM